MERALDAVVYAPLGVALFARDTMPSFVRMFVTRGRSAVNQQVNQARSMGQFAVKFGGPVVARRVEDSVASARAHAEATVASLLVGRGAIPSNHGRHTNGDRPARAEGGDGATPTRPRAQLDSSPGPKSSGPAAASLAIPDYDELSASQVVHCLEGLHRNDLDDLADYETAHRGRRTILGKIAQLRA